MFQAALKTLYSLRKRPTDTIDLKAKDGEENKDCIWESETLRDFYYILYLLPLDLQKQKMKVTNCIWDRKIMIETSTGDPETILQIIRALNFLDFCIFISRPTYQKKQKVNGDRFAHHFF